MEHNFRQILNENELFELLRTYNDVFAETIESRVGDLAVYAKKLLQNAQSYVLECNNSIAGIVIFYANDQLKKIAYLTMIAVGEDYKEKGYGTLLLKHCEEKSKEEGMEKLSLEVDLRNSPAIEFYKRKDFIFTDKASENSIYMTKELM